MPAITMLSTSASPEAIMLPGKTYRVGSELARELVDGGYALPAKPAAKPERVPAQPDPEDTPEAVEDDDEDDEE